MRTIYGNFTIRVLALCFTSANELRGVDKVIQCRRYITQAQATDLANIHRVNVSDPKIYSYSWQAEAEEV